MNTPSVSIIIPTYNHARFIGRCLRSVISQTFQNWEAIVVNNYSTDNTLEVIESVGDERIRVIDFRNNGIIAASRNCGIQAAMAPHIAFLDSDDSWLPNKLAYSMPQLSKASLVYHDLVVENQNGITEKVFKGKQLKKPVFADLMLSSTVIFNSSVVTYKHLIEEVGGLSESKQLIGGEDSDLWLRLAMITDNFHHIPKVLGTYWWGSGNFTEYSDHQVSLLNALHARHIYQVPAKYQKHAAAMHSYAIGRLLHKMDRAGNALVYLNKALKAGGIKLKLKAFGAVLAALFKSIKQRWPSGERS